MNTLPDYFSDLISSIEPSDERAEAAADIPAKVREYLKACDDVKTVAPHSRLAGSYARHTAIKDIKDVDIVLLVDETYLDEAPEVVLNDLYRALKGLPEALEDSGVVEAACRHQRRSVHVELVQQEFCLDVVPAVATDGLDQPLQIPDRDWEKWIETDPLGYGGSLSVLNQAQKEKVVPLAKLFKHWRDVQMIYLRPKSYWLEVLTYHLFMEGILSADGKSYAELFRDLLGGTLSRFEAVWADKEVDVPAIDDPRLGNNIAHNWTRNEFDRFMTCLQQSHGWAERALAQPATDEGKIQAITLWRNIFGEDWFPLESSVDRALRVSKGLYNGTVYVTGTGTVLTQRPSEPALQVPRQRFYGE